MSLRFFIPVIIFIPLLILQLTIIPLISIEYIAPDLIVIVLVYYTLLYGQIYGTLLGFFLGFLYDIFSGGLIGGLMFSMTLTGFVAGYFYNANKIEQNTNSHFLVLAVMICASVNSLAYSFIIFTGPVTKPLVLFFEQGILPGLFTSVFAFVFLVIKNRKLMS